MNLLPSYMNDREQLDALTKAFENANIYLFVYSPKQRTVRYSDKTCERYGVAPLWENAPESSLGIVHPLDRKAYTAAFRKIAEGESTSEAFFTRGVDLDHCFKITLSTVATDDDGTVKTAIGVIEDATEAYKSEQMATRIQRVMEAAEEDEENPEKADGLMSRTLLALGSQYYAIYHIWMNDLTYVCFQEELPGILSAIGERGKAVPAWKIYIDEYIVAEDRTMMREFADFSTMADRLRAANSVTCEYRRIGVGWTQGRFMVAQRDENGCPTHIVYTVLDINAEKERQLRTEQATFEASHDPLTKALNRKAFEDLVESEALADTPVGFALIDVDGFKALNDEYGHETGDEVLAETVKAMSEAFRSNDSIFRIGGDEFAVLIRGFDESHWDILCEKIRKIRTAINEATPKSLDITLSVGACFSDAGFGEWMYPTADKGLYNTKRNGRAGCTLVGKDGTVLDHRKDEGLSARTRLALAGSNVDFCRIELPKDPSAPSRLVCGEILRGVYGFPDNASPEEAFKLWYENVDPQDRPVLHEAMLVMAQRGDIECDIVWHHPTDGPITIRMSGSGETTDDAVVMVGLHRSMKDAVIVEREDDSKDLFAAQSAIYFCSAYLDLSTKKFSWFNTAREITQLVGNGENPSDLIKNYLSNLVHPDQRERMTEFMNLETLPERIGDNKCIDCEYFGLNCNGWCRASWLPVKRDETGRVTHVLFSILWIDADKQEEIEKEREAARLMSLHYEAAGLLLDSPIIAISLIDKRTEALTAWTADSGFSEGRTLEYSDFLESETQQMPEGKRKKAKDALALSNVVCAVENNGTYLVPVEIITSTGKTRHLEYRFAAYSHDGNKLISAVKDVTHAQVEKGRSVEDLYENVPGGLVTYEWDGSRLKVLHISKYYDTLYGYSIANNQSGDRSPDFERVHPDDLEAYKEAIHRALSETRKLHYTYRVWNERKGAYAWAKIDAVAKPAKNGNMLVYAMYSDVTEQMETKRRLSLKTESLIAALNESKQVRFEYYPQTRTVECLTEKNHLGIPQHMENFPNAAETVAALHPDDLGLFRDTVAEIDEGASHAHCDVRVACDGDYRWYSCRFDQSPDDQQGRKQVAFNMIDTTMRVLTMQAFENRVKSLLCADKDALSVSSFNLSQNLIVESRFHDADLAKTPVGNDYDQAVETVASAIVDEKDARRYRALFSAKSLVEAARRGETRVSCECMFRVSPTRTEWLLIAIELISNPLTGDVEGIGYSKSVSRHRMSELLVKRGLNVDYPAAAVLINEGDEYYLFDFDAKNQCEHRLDFWTGIENRIRRMSGEKGVRRMRFTLQREAVLEKLRNNKEVSFVFERETDREEERARYALRFSTLDSDRGLILAAMRNITDEDLMKKIQHDAHHDALTDLYNRKTVFQKCEQLLVEHPDENFAILHLNVRRFRLFNSFFGEKAGDELLCTIADGLRLISADYDYCAYGRIESDIFCIMFPIKPYVFERHIEYLKRSFNSYCDNFLLEPSIGVYDILDRSLSIESMFARATTAAKEGGLQTLGIVNNYDESLDHRLSEELNIVNEMQQALEEEQFVVYLQPKFDLQTGTHKGAEALVRWISPKQGLVPPSKFIPVFERNGFISSLDRYMWEKTCALLRKWQDNDLEVRPISVNMSRVSAYDPTTASFLMQLVTDYRIDPKLLEIELTESAYVDDSEEIKARMRELQDFGFTILMDDFGSGYSSLNTLRELPVDFLKLDIRFLTENCEDERGRTVLSSMVDMTKRLSLPVVAEGVETPAQADYLASLGCEYVQGFLFAKPMPVNEYEKLHQANRSNENGGGNDKETTNDK